MQLDVIQQALEYIDSDDRDTWLRVGMALEAEGFDYSVWDEWSAKSGKYKPIECEKAWNKFHEREDGVKGGTIIKLAQENGFVPEYDQSAQTPDVGYRRTRPKKTQEEQPKKSVCVEKVEPTPSKPQEPVSGAKALQLYLKTLYDVDDKVIIIADSVQDKESEKWGPIGNGKLYRVGDLIQALDVSEIGMALRNFPDERAGAWIRINPMKRIEGRDADVAKYRYTLIESDKISKETQCEYYKDLDLPIAALVDSGGKSVHAIVKIDAFDKDEYEHRVNYLHRVLNKEGVEPDRQDKNESRLSRLPGVIRNGREQKLLGVNLGSPSWDSWVTKYKETLAKKEIAKQGVVSLGEVDLDSISEPRDLIEGILKVGGELEITGKKKYKKTWFAFQLAFSLAAGTKFLGHQCEKSKVLFCNLELGKQDMLFRAKTVIEAFEAEKPENLFIYSPKGKGRKAVIESIASMARAFDVVVLDPIYTLFEGDENDSKTMTQFVEEVPERIKSEGPTVIYTHHQPKGAQGEKDTGDRGNGSGVLARHYDSVLDIARLENVPEDLKPTPNSSPCRVYFEGRSHAEFDPIDCWFDYPLWKLADVSEGKSVLDKYGEKGSAKYVRSCNVKKGEETATDVYDTIDEMLHDKKYTALNNGGVRIADVEKKLGISKNTVKAKLDAASDCYRRDRNGIIYPV